MAGRLSDRLAGRFGESHVFIDVDAIQPGEDFAEAIFRAVAACTVLLAIIGPSWLTAADARGSRRLEDPQDLVRLEIQAALTRGVRVIPILVEGAMMPAPDDLPDGLAGLARLHALHIRHETFDSDAGSLMAAVERVLASSGTAAVSSSGPVQDNAAQDNAAQDNAVRDNAVRVTRFLADAGRIANSMTVGYWKAAALSNIGEALAPTDSDRAARLFTDAERIANSITGESEKADALSNIAQALAPTDPDRAERIAGSLTRTFFRAVALSNTAKALAPTDPGRAARLCTDAERIASSITDESAQAEALSDVAKALATTSE